MSIHHMAQCWYTTTLAPNQRLVALALADFADDHGRCWPSLGTISQKVGYSRRNTQRIVQELRKAGYVEILIEATHNRTPLYQLHPEVLSVERMIEPPLPLPPPEQGRQSVTPRDDTGVTPEVTPPSQGDDTGVTQTVIEPSPEPPTSELAETANDDVSRETLTDRNLGWDALSELFEYEPQGSEQSLWGKLAAKANLEDDPRAAVRDRAMAIISQWGAKALTPPSLLKHWDRAATELGRATDDDVERLKAEHDREQRRRRAEQATKALEAQT